jgi:hypothetical protein
VSTSFSDDIRTFAHCTYLAEGHDIFLQKVESALAEHDPALAPRRAEVAQSNTWAARIAQLWDLVNERLSN